MKKYDKYKNSGVEWLGEIPAHWEIKKLKYIADIKTGYTPLTSRENNFSENGMIWAKPENLNGFKPIMNSKEKISPIGIKNQNIISKGSVLVCSIGSIGKFGIAGIDLTTNQQINSITFKNGLDKEYGKYLIANCETEFSKWANGTVVRILNTSAQGNIFFISPPIKEQIAISNFLNEKTNKIDQAIVIKQKQIELLKEHKHSLINKAVIKGINPNVKLKNSNIEWIGEIPEHWEIVSKMKFISSMKARQGWQGLKVNEYTDEGPYVLSSAHYNNHIIDWSKCPRVSIKRYLMDENIQLKIGDILLMKDGANMGKLALVESLPGLACLNSHLLLFRPLKKDEKPMYFPKFMFYHMMCQKFQDYVKINGTGATFSGISQESLGNYQISLPPLSEQKEIVEFIENTTNKIAIAISLKQQEIEKLKEYKMSLIDGVVTGKVRVY